MPPYCGVRDDVEVAVVLDVVVGVADDVTVGVVVFTVVEAVVVVCVCVEVVVAGVVLPQEARTNDNTIRKLMASQRTLLFTLYSPYFIRCGNALCRRYVGNILDS